MPENVPFPSPAILLSRPPPFPLSPFSSATLPLHPSQVDEAQKALQFVSISSDGNVNLWTMNKSELTHEHLMKLKVVQAGPKGQAEEAAGGEDGSAASSAAGGCCMDFSKVSARKAFSVSHTANVQNPSFFPDPLPILSRRLPSFAPSLPSPC